MSWIVGGEVDGVFHASSHNAAGNVWIVGGEVGGVFHASTHQGLLASTPAITSVNDGSAIPFGAADVVIAGSNLSGATNLTVNGVAQGNFVAGASPTFGLDTWPNALYGASLTLDLRDGSGSLVTASVTHTVPTGHGAQTASGYVEGAEGVPTGIPLLADPDQLEFELLTTTGWVPSFDPQLRLTLTDPDPGGPGAADQNDYGTFSVWVIDASDGSRTGPVTVSPQLETFTFADVASASTVGSIVLSTGFIPLQDVLSSTLVDGFSLAQNVLTLLDAVSGSTLDTLTITSQLLALQDAVAGSSADSISVARNLLSVSDVSSGAVVEGVSLSQRLLVLQSLLSSSSIDVVVIFQELFPDIDIDQVQILGVDESEDVFMDFDNVASFVVLYRHLPLPWNTITRMVLTLVDFNISIDTAVSGSENRIVWSSTESALLLRVSGLNGLVKGTTRVRLVVYDSSHTNGQVLIHESSGQGLSLNVL